MTTVMHEASALERLQIIQSATSVALVGVSANILRSSNFVATYLVRTDLDMYPVNPMYEEILGLKSYPSLADLPVVPDIVDVFRRHDELPNVVDEAIAVGAKVVWFQLGLRHDEAAARPPPPGCKWSRTVASRSSTLASRGSCTWPASIPGSSPRRPAETAVGHTRPW